MILISNLKQRFISLNLVGVNANSFKSYSYIFRAGLSVEAQKSLDDNINLLRKKIYESNKKQFDVRVGEEDSRFEIQKNMKEAIDEENKKLYGKIKNSSEQALIKFTFDDKGQVKPAYQDIYNNIQSIIASQVSGETASIPHEGIETTIENYSQTPMSTVKNHE